MNKLKKTNIKTPPKPLKHKEVPIKLTHAQQHFYKHIEVQFEKTKLELIQHFTEEKLNMQNSMCRTFQLIIKENKKSANTEMQGLVKTEMHIMVDNLNSYLDRIKIAEVQPNQKQLMNKLVDNNVAHKQLMDKLVNTNVAQQQLFNKLVDTNVAFNKVVADMYQITTKLKKSVNAETFEVREIKIGKRSINLNKHHQRLINDIIEAHGENSNEYKAIKFQIIEDSNQFEKNQPV